MKEILNKLFDHYTLGRDEARELLVRIAAEEYDPLQVASFITVFNVRSIVREELEGFRDAMLELCKPLSLNGMESLDIVGTGGDGKNTFNISTTSAIVVAGAGYKVTKHGSYGVSSAVGSSNVLLALGYEFTNDPDTLRRQLDKANVCFLHAPLFHPAMKAVVPIRKALKVKTFFNLLGPLVNPVQPSHQVFGTFSLELSRMYHYIMQNTGRRFAIVHALDGYDEISLTGPFKLYSNAAEKLLSAEQLDKPAYRQQDLYGGETPEEAADIFKAVLEDRATPAQKDVVVANAGLGIHTMRPERSLADCMAEAQESIESGKALASLKALLN